ncbi:MAG TPA: hypothetical protein VKF37_09495 [Chloroflexota bacterium]|nr:hypothetical protein [Chloroflexota bacterium]
MRTGGDLERGVSHAPRKDTLLFVDDQLRTTRIALEKRMYA